MIDVGYVKHCRFSIKENSMYRADLSRRIGPVFADAAVDAAFDSPDKPGYPDGWGTSPHLRRSLSKTRCALSPSSSELLATHHETRTQPANHDTSI